MKRLVSFFLLFVFVFGFTGCKSQTREKKKQTGISTAVAATVKSTSQKAEEKSVEKTKVLYAEKNEEKYIGNKNTLKFHRRSCGALPKEKNRVYLNSREEAINTYYEPCKKCNP